NLFVASVQIGDGALFVWQPDKGSRLQDQWHWLQQPQIQTVGNEVQPFTRAASNIWSQFLHTELLVDATFIMGMTDGTADDIEPPRATPENPHPDPFFYGNDFHQHLES